MPLRRTLVVPACPLQDHTTTMSSEAIAAPSRHRRPAPRRRLPPSSLLLLVLLSLLLSLLPRSLSSLTPARVGLESLCARCVLVGWGDVDSDTRADALVRDDTLAQRSAA